MGNEKWGMIKVCKMNVMTTRADYGQRHSSFVISLSSFLFSMYWQQTLIFSLRKSGEIVYTEV